MTNRIYVLGVFSIAFQKYYINHTCTSKHWHTYLYYRMLKNDLLLPSKIYYRELTSIVHEIRQLYRLLPHKMYS